MEGSSYREHAPDPRLAGWVRCYWSSVVGAGPVRAHPVLPDGCVDLLFHVTPGGARLDLVGTMTRALWVEGCGPARFVGVRFEPGAAAVLLRERADLWTDQQPGAGAVMGRAGDALAERLTEAGEEGGVPAAIAVLEAFLLERVPDADPVDPRVAHVASCLRRAPDVRVADLARDLGVSRQYLRRLFVQHTGMAPKLFGRVARLERLVVALARPVTLAAAAADAAYADQAHMTREMRALAGTTPARYRELLGFPSVQDGAPGSA